MSNRVTSEGVITVEISSKIHDKIIALGRHESFEQVLTRLVESIKYKSTEKIPETFEDYYRLVDYFTKIGAFVVMHKTRLESDSVVLRLGELILYYRLKDDKFIRCKAEEMFKSEDKAKTK